MASRFSRRKFCAPLGSLAAAAAALPYWFTGRNARADESRSKNDRPRIAGIRGGRPLGSR